MKRYLLPIFILFFSTIAFADIIVKSHCGVEQDIAFDKDHKPMLVNSYVCTSTPEDWVDNGKE